MSDLRLAILLRGVTALTRAVSGEKQIYSGNLEILPGIGKPGKSFGTYEIFSGNLTIYMHSDMHPVYVLYFMYFDT